MKFQHRRRFILFSEKATVYLDLYQKASKDIREGIFLDTYENLAQKTLFSYEIAHSIGNRLVPKKLLIPIAGVFFNFMSSKSCSFRMLHILLEHIVNHEIIQIFDNSRCKSPHKKDVIRSHEIHI